MKWQEENSSSDTHSLYVSSWGWEKWHMNTKKREREEKAWKQLHLNWCIAVLFIKFLMHSREKVVKIVKWLWKWAKGTRSFSLFTVVTVNFIRLHSSNFRIEWHEWPFDMQSTVSFVWRLRFNRSVNINVQLVKKSSADTIDSAPI